MILLLDIGNTRIKWALQEEGSQQTDFLVSGDVLRIATAEEAIVGLCQTVGDALDAGVNASVSGLTTVTVSNVGGQSIADLLAVGLQQRFGVAPGFVQSERKVLGLSNGYSDVSQLGVDRWVAMVAAASAAGSDYCVVDAGTAVTIDYVDGDLEHQGGVIFPGLAVMRNALFASTENIRVFAEKTATPETTLLLGRTTDAAVRSGALQAAVGAVERVMDSGTDACRLIVTGGDGISLLPWLDQYKPDYRPFLVLEGVSRLANAA